MTPALPQRSAVMSGSTLRRHVVLVPTSTAISTLVRVQQGPARPTRPTRPPSRAGCPVRPELRTVLHPTTDAAVVERVAFEQTWRTSLAAPAQYPARCAWRSTP